MKVDKSYPLFGTKIAQINPNLIQEIIMFKKSMKTLVIVVIALTLTGFSYAFAAANTMPTASHSGDGSVVISGYTVSAVSYELNTTNPANIDAVKFTLNAPATLVKIQLNGTDWYTCTNSGLNWTCATTSPQATVLGATSLRVIASD